jgi:hypothetical protein
MRRLLRENVTVPVLGIGEPFGECLIEVVAHLSFQFYFLKGLKAGESADAAEIIVGLRQPEIISEDAQLHVLSVLRGSGKYKAARQEK